jgi:hypothetical protein
MANCRCQRSADGGTGDLECRLFNPRRAVGLERCPVRAQGSKVGLPTSMEVICQEKTRVLWARSGERAFR